MKKDDVWTEEAWIERFCLEAMSPGYIYVIENRGLFKIGKSKHKRKRLQSGLTWLPDMKIVGVKPFWDYEEKERLLHVGNAFSWYDREWFCPSDKSFHGYFVDEFQAFSDTDINRNSVNFIYWYNGSGMAEFAHQQRYQKLPIRRFQIQETLVGKSGK
jgi:hypothetical protein